MQSDDEDERPKLKRLTEDERREKTRQRVGITSVRRDDLWRQRQESNAWGKKTKEHP